ncbi:hypothetical protein AB751O23_CT_00010, partial [Chlamydiales bacterium SCGC AB-751-O23]
TYLISIINDLLEAQVWEIESTQLDQFLDTEIASLETTTTDPSSPTITYFSKAQIETLDKAQLQAAIEEWTLTQMQAITSTQLSAFLDTEIAVMPTASLIKLSATQLSFFSPAQVFALNSDQVSSMDSTQITAVVGRFSTTPTNQIDFLTTTQAQALTLVSPANLSTLQVQALDNTKHIIEMTGAQIKIILSDLSLIQIPILTPTQIIAFTDTDIAALTKEQASEFTATQINSMTTLKAQAISRDAIKLMDVSQIQALLPFLSEAQVQALTIVQVQAIPAIANSPEQDISNFNNISKFLNVHFDVLVEAQIDELTNAQIDSLSNEQLARVYPLLDIDSNTDGSTALDYLVSEGRDTDIQTIHAGGLPTPIPFDDIAGITEASELLVTLLEGWNEEFIQEIDPTVIANMTQAQIAIIFESLTPTQMASVDEDITINLSDTLFENLSAAQVEGLVFVNESLSEGKIQSLASQTIKDLSHAYLISIINDLLEAQVQEIEPIQLDLFTDTEIGTDINSPTITYFSTSQMETLDKLQLQAAITEWSLIQMQAITSSQLSSFLDTEIAVMPTASLIKLSATQLSFFSPAQVYALNSDQVSHMDPAQITAVAARLSTDPINQIGYLTTAQAQALTLESPANLSTLQVQALDNTKHIIEMSGAQIKIILSDLSLAQIPALTPTQINDLLDTDIADLTKEQTLEFIPAQLTSMEPIQAQAISTDAIKLMNAAQIQAMLSNLSEDQVQTLEIAQIEAIPATATSPDLDISDFTNIGKLLDTQIDVLTEAQIDELTNTQLDIGSLANEQLARIYPLLNTDYNTNGSTALDYLESVGRKSDIETLYNTLINPPNLNTIDIVDVGTITEASLFTPTILSGWSEGYIQAIDPAVIANMTPAQITIIFESLTPTQMASVDEDITINLSDTLFENLSAVQVEALVFVNESLSEGKIQSLASQTIKDLSHTYLISIINDL